MNHVFLRYAAAALNRLDPLSEPKLFRNAAFIAACETNVMELL